jgi:RimJ/RimL family protein N-acetyltransferase
VPRLVPSVVSPGSIARLKQPILTGNEGISLRPWTETDVGAVVDAFLDPDIQRWHLRCLDAEEARRWIEAWHERWANESDASWAISTGGDALGYIALRDIDFEFGQGEITYWVRPAFRRRGLAIGAARVLAEWALTAVGLHRLEIRHSTANAESCQVALRAGFALEGTARSALLHADGWHDMHVHARLRPTSD